MDRRHILAEISRTAEENGGVPLGAGRFEQATGIRRHDWQGRYWPRWGDAVREAGYEPQALTPRAERQTVIEAYIALARRLRKLPVTSELVLEARARPGFPWHTTVMRHLGRSKADRVITLREYCQERGSDYDDIAAMLPEAAPESPRRAAQVASTAMGSVYLLKAGRYYKVGRTNAIGRREYELAIQLPERASLVHEIRTDDPEGIEAYWHKRFASRRGNGEWFALTADDVTAFRRRKFM